MTRTQKNSENVKPLTHLNSPVAQPGPNQIVAAQREERNGHRGTVIWLTGLSGAGKTTIAVELERQLFHSGNQTYLLDGDVLRRGLCSDLDYSVQSRHENIRRAGELAALLMDAGNIVIAAFISPFRIDRERVRNMVPPGRFIEVFVNAPLEVCAQRDVKGLYARARANQIPNFTGISAPYEIPETPEIELPTDRISAAEAVAAIVAYLYRNGIAGTASRAVLAEDERRSPRLNA
jgi:adenylylsulfate kinase